MFRFRGNDWGRAFLGGCVRLSLPILLAGAIFFPFSLVSGATPRRISLAHEIPVTLPQGGYSAGQALGGMVGGALGQIMIEVDRARTRKAGSLAASDYGAADALRTAVTGELRQKRLLASREKAEAELRLQITECGVMPPRGALFSKNVSPVLAVRALLVNDRGNIIWEERRRIFGGKAPKIPKEKFVANPGLAKPAMEKIAGLIATDIVQALVTPGTGHKWDAIRREYDPLPWSRPKPSR